MSGGRVTVLRLNSHYFVFVLFQNLVFILEFVFTECFHPDMFICQITKQSLLDVFSAAINRT